MDDFRSVMKDHWAKKCSTVINNLKAKIPKDAYNARDFANSPVVVSLKRYLQAIKRLSADNGKLNIANCNKTHFGDLSTHAHNLAICQNEFSMSMRSITALDRMFVDILDGIRALQWMQKIISPFYSTKDIVPADFQAEQRRREEKAIQNMLDEALVMWVTAFGQEMEVSFERWWDVFIDHMSVYGIYDDHRIGTVKMIFKGILGGEVTLMIFREHMLRFGPFDKVLLKTCAMASKEGTLYEWFVPKKFVDPNDEMAFLDAHPKLLLLIRPASVTGLLTHVDPDKKQMIHLDKSGKKRHVKHKIWCLPSGYYIKLAKDDVPKCQGETVIDVLKNFSGYKSEYKTDVQLWVTEIGGLQDRPPNDSYINLADVKLSRKVSANTKLDIQAERIEAVQQSTNMISKKIDDVHQDLVQLNMRALAELDATMPKRFVMKPICDEEKSDCSAFESLIRKFQKNASFSTKWKVYVLCDGSPDAEGICASFKDTGFKNAEGYTISLPKEEFLNILPAIRSAFTVATIAVKVTTGGAVDLGPLKEILGAVAEGGTYDAVCRKVNSKLKRVSQIANRPLEDMQSDSEIINDYKSLRSLIARDHPKLIDDMKTGVFGGLSLMWSSELSRHFWVCDNPSCRNNLTHMNSENHDASLYDPNKENPYMRLPQNGEDEKLEVTNTNSSVEFRGNASHKRQGSTAYRAASNFHFFESESEQFALPSPPVEETNKVELPPAEAILNSKPPSAKNELDEKNVDDEEQGQVSHVQHDHDRYSDENRQGEVSSPPVMEMQGTVITHTHEEPPEYIPTKCDNAVSPSVHKIRSKLTIHIMGARGLWNSDGGLAHCFRGLSDPYVRIFVKDSQKNVIHQERTRVVHNNLDPDWDDKVSWTLNSDDDGKFSYVVEFEIYDHGRFRKDIFLGRNCIGIDSADFVHDPDTHDHEHGGHLQLKPKLNQKKNAEKMRGTLIVKVECHRLD